MAVFRNGFDCCPADGAVLAPAAGVDPLIGAEIADRYVIEDLVGEGSMGMIYRARHLRLPARFAIKVLFGDLVADPRMRLRFAQEAALASRLSHPNVVSVVDFGRSDDGLLYLVMSYVEGEPLSDLIAREAPLDTAQAMRLTRQLAQGLGHAHAQGLVHRDFKPGNVVLERTENGPTPRILDFGLAISMNEHDQPGEEVAGRLTECGLIVGTPIYIAPEQALDRPVDHRADLFALGVTMFEMLTGRPPFDGNPVEIAHKNVSHPVPAMSQRRPGLEVPVELERVVRRLMSKSPDKRYASADELCAALDEVEWSLARAKTQGMRTASQVMRPASQAHHPSSQRMRAAVYDPDAPGADEASADADDAISDYTWKIERRGGRAAKVLGSLVAAAAAAVALASWQGWIDVGLFEPTVQEASAASEEVDGPAVAVGSPTAVPAPGADLTATSPRPSAAVTALADSPATGAAPQARSSRPRRAVAPTREERRRDEPRPWTEARARPAEGAAPAEEEVAPVIAPTAPAIAPTAPAGNDVALAAPQPAPAPAAPLAEVKQTPVSVGSSASVDRLIRDYRDVGQSISHLQARGGDEAARRLRDRYFRLPYGDALRIPAVRRDALAELAGLRREVEAAIESLASQPNG